MTFALLLSVSLWLAGCSTEPPTPRHISLAETVVIVVPGLYGTQLVQDVSPEAQAADKRIIWLSLSEALVGRTSLMLPLPGMEYGEAVPLREDGLLETVTIVPGIYAVDLYRSLVKSLRESGNDRVAVLPFAYDWRLDVMHGVQGLAGLVDEVHRRGAKQTILVGHSLGGLIVSYYLRYGAQNPETAEETWEGTRKVAKVVMAGVPFRGSMTMFRNVLHGWKVGLNRSLLAPTAYASFPVSYYLLPALDSDVLLSPDLKPVHGLVRDPEKWRQMGWGLLREPGALRDDVSELRARYTASWLQRSERFITLLHTPPAGTLERQIPLLYISGSNVPTLARGVLLNDPAGGPNRVVFDAALAEGASSTMSPDLFIEDGDGTVTGPAARLPTAYSQNMAVTRRTYHETHADLMTSRKVHREIQAFLRTPRER